MFKITTKTAGGVVSYRIAATLEANYAAAIGDVVMAGPGDYQCTLCDGTLPALGDVVMPNVRRGSGSLAGTYPQPNVPGDVTIGLKGHAIQTKKAGATITVGTQVNIGANGKIFPSGTSTTQSYGIALNGGILNTAIDVVVN